MGLLRSRVFYCDRVEQGLLHVMCSASKPLTGSVSPPYTSQGYTGSQSIESNLIQRLDQPLAPCISASRRHAEHFARLIKLPSPSSQARSRESDVSWGPPSRLALVSTSPIVESRQTRLSSRGQRVRDQPRLGWNNRMM